MSNKNNINSVFRVEVFVVLGFFLLFMMWSISKCKQTKKEYANKEILENDESSALLSEEEVGDEAVIPSTTLVDRNAKPEDLEEKPKAEKKPTASKPEIKAAPQTAPPSKFNKSDGKQKLFVVIDQLNMRSKPGLKAPLVTKLNLYDEVMFTGEATDTTSTINMGSFTATEPWIKVKTASGTTGWVFGAGISYIKKKKM